MKVSHLSYFSKQLEVNICELWHTNPSATFWNQGQARKYNLTCACPKNTHKAKVCKLSEITPTVHNWSLRAIVATYPRNNSKIFYAWFTHTWFVIFHIILSTPLHYKNANKEGTYCLLEATKGATMLGLKWVFTTSLHLNLDWKHFYIKGLRRG